MKKILVPTDYSTCAQAALLHAFLLARHFNAELHLLHVVEGVGESQKGKGIDEAPRSIAESINDSARRFDDVPVHRITQYGKDPTQAILTYARENNADLIIMGAHGDSAANRFLICGLDYLLIGTTAEQIVRMATCPVLTVGLRKGRYPSLVKRILLPVDLSSPDEAAVVYARELATIYGAELNLLYVFESALNGRFNTRSSEWQAIEARSKEQLERLYHSTTGPEVPVHFHVVPGKPAREISAFAERQDIQLIVLSSHGMASKEQGPLQHENEPIVQMASFSVLTTRASQKGESVHNQDAGLSQRLDETVDTSISFVKS